jgi:hypothetical protein
MSTTLVPGIATLSVTTGVALPSQNGAQASISVVVTDAAGTVYQPVLLYGTETPTPYAYPATFAAGAATAVASALDVNGAVIGTPASYPFTVTSAASATTFTAPAGFGFVATGASAAAAVKK